MADSIPGGAYLVNGAWVNADGKPLNKAQADAAKALNTERDALLRMEEEDRLLRAVKNDPMAQVLAKALGGQQGQAATVAPAPALAATHRATLTDEERQARTEAAATANEEEHRADVAARKGAKG